MLRPRALCDQYAREFAAAGMVPVLAIALAVLCTVLAGATALPLFLPALGVVINKERGAQGPKGAAGTTVAEVEALVEAQSYWVNAKRHGAKGNGVADDTAALQAMIEALPVAGGTIILPAGVYNFTALDCKEKRGITIRGVGGSTSGATQGSVLNCTSEGAGIALQGKGTSGLALIDVALINNTEAYTGTLCSLSGSAFFEAVRCDFIGRKLSTGFNLDSAQVVGFEKCAFGGCKNQVLGVKEAATFSNAVAFFKCTFKNCQTMPIVNPGEAWEFLNCVVEPLEEAGKKEAWIECVLAAEGLGITGCWFGDGNKTGTWVKFNGSGLSVTGGNEIGTGLVAIEISATTVGFDISGNKFDSCGTAIKLNPGCLSANVLANAYPGCTKTVDLNGATPSGIVHLIDSESNPVSIGNSLIFDGDVATRFFRRAAGITKTLGTLEAGAGLKSNQGGATSITVAEDTITAAGANAVQNLSLDAKGEGAFVQIATRGLATGGTKIGVAGSKIGVFGVAPSARRAAIASPAETLASLKTAVDFLREALKAFGWTE